MAKINSFFMLKKYSLLKGIPETLDDVTLRRAAARLLSFCFHLVNFSGLNFKSWLPHTFGLVCNQKDSGLKRGKWHRPPFDLLYHGYWSYTECFLVNSWWLKLRKFRLSVVYPSSCFFSWHYGNRFSLMPFNLLGPVNSSSMLWVM